MGEEEEEGRKEKCGSAVQEPQRTDFVQVEFYLGRLGLIWSCILRLSRRLVVSTTARRLQVALGLLCIFTYPQFSVGWI